MDRFDDRKIIITGAGSGIGRATVARLLEEGGTVVAYDVSADGLAKTAAAAENAGTAKRLTTAVLDVSSEDAVIAGVGQAVDDLGGLDVLVNAAAIQLCAHTHEHTLADWNHTLAVNLTGTFLMTRQALPALCESGRGVVVNFTSTAASFAHPYMAAYAASKGGIAGAHAFACAGVLKAGAAGGEYPAGRRLDRSGQHHAGQDARRATTSACGRNKLRCCTGR